MLERRRNIGGNVRRVTPGARAPLRRRRSGSSSTHSAPGPGRRFVTGVDPGAELADAFAHFDRARLAHSDRATRAAQLAARQAVYEYVEELWRDIGRSGESRAAEGKYQAIASIRELTKSLRGAAFEAVYGSTDD